MSQVKTVPVDGIEIEYEEWGEGERAFVLAHGFTGSRDDWREVLPELAGHGRTVALDQRGHGGTTNPGVPDGYHFDQLVADLLGFLDAVGIERCDLLGHSMGGRVAMRFAMAHPERVLSLVLMDTTARPFNQARRHIFEMGGELARREGMTPLYEAVRKLMPTDAAHPPAARRLAEGMGEEFWRRTRAKYEAMDPEAFATLGLELVDHPGVADRLDEIRCPTTVIVGEQDAPYLEAAEELERGIPDATRVVISDAAHSPQQENTPAWLEAVRAHLARARG